MGLFRDKKQVEQVKAVPVLEATKTKTSKLHLTRLQITYSVAMVQPYRANIDYAERPKNWDDHGVTSSEEIKAESWPELIDKVVEHFKDADKA